MKTRLSLCFALLVTVVLRAATPEEARIVQRAAEVDNALVTGDMAVLESHLNADYVYVEPRQSYQPAAKKPAGPGSLGQKIGARRQRDYCRMDEPPEVHVVGDTAIITGTYRVIPRDDESTGRPRMLLQGRFTETWVRTGAGWQLLAEHRSLNDRQAWAAVAGAPAWSPPVATPETAATDPAPTQKEAAKDEPAAVRAAQARDHRGFLPATFGDFFHAYEPTSIGYTWDQGDEGFMDFTFSDMLPLSPNARDFPDPVRELTEQGFRRPFNPAKPALYFAANVRAGQYIGTRPSAPVVGKRFNPLFALRFWFRDGHDALESAENFFEVVYAHESNGQFISSRERFDQQLQTFLDQAHDAHTPADADIASRSAYHSARDNISRGWDYVGVQFARDWDSEGRLPWLAGRKITQGLRAKFNYYLPYGAFQKEWEQYNAWEGDPQGKPRSHVDGLSLRYTVTILPTAKKSEWNWLMNSQRFQRRYSLIWTTGYADPFRFNTFRLEGSAVLFDQFPFTLWYRYGYNSDLIDYYRKDHSLGVSLSYWNF